MSEIDDLISQARQQELPLTHLELELWLYRAHQVGFAAGFDHGVVWAS